MMETRELLASASGCCPMDTDLVILATQHVNSGRLIILRQRQLIAKKRELGLSTSSSESLLVTFEASQAIFEEHLQALLQQQDLKSEPSSTKVVRIRQQRD